MREPILPIENGVIHWSGTGFRYGRCEVMDKQQVVQECTHYAGVDLTRHPALKEAYRIACLIEACGASPELTTASCAAFDFIRMLNDALPVGIDVKEV